MRRKELGYNRAGFILVMRFVLCMALAVWTSTCAAQVATKKSVAILDFENAAILSLLKTRFSLSQLNLNDGSYSVQMPCSRSFAYWLGRGLAPGSVGAA